MIFVLAGLLIVAGCGSATSEPQPLGGSGAAVTVTRPPVATSARPPTPFLTSPAGRQEAVVGSYCVEGQMESGCGDSGPIHPTELSVAHPGDELTFSLESASVVRAEGCHGSDEQGCIGSVTVRPLGCERKAVSTIPLEKGRETHWTVGLDAGPYQLDLFAYFRADDGRTGDVSGTFGLLVQPGGDLKIQPVDPQQAACPFSG
jgi:hypothetical protein